MKLGVWKTFAVFTILSAIIGPGPKNICIAASATSFPTTGWHLSTPEEQGIRSQMLADMMEHIHDRKISIDSIQIVRNG
jgi:hypothetical protein